MRLPLPVLIVRILASAVVLALIAALSACGSRQRQGNSATPSDTAPAPAALPGAGRPAVTIGDKNYTEQFLLGQLYKQALRGQGFTVSLTPNIGPREVTLSALESGRLAMYPEYLDTWVSQIARDDRSFQSWRAALQAGRAYAASHGFALLAPTRFSDTDAIGVTEGYAVQNDLHSLADLRNVASALTLGAPPQFQQSPTGLPALEQVYGFVPAAFKAVDVGAQYQALDTGVVQAADVNTTDPQLSSGGYRLLRDPQRVFGWGNVVPVVSAKVLAAEGPAFAATINRVSALLTTAMMRRLNAAVDLYHRDPATVAKQFLRARGMLPGLS